MRVLHVLTLALLLCPAVAQAAGFLPPGNNSAVSSGGSVSTDLDLNSHNLAEVGDIYGPTAGSDADPGTLQIHGPNAYPTASTNKNGGALELAGGLATHTVAISDYTLCAGDTVTVTVDGVAHVLTEGADFTAATSNAATCTSLQTAAQLLAGISAASVCSTATLALVAGPSVYALTVDVSDGTCAAAVNGVAGGVFLKGDTAVAGAVSVTGNISTVDPGTSASSYSLTLWADNATTPQPAQLQVIYGADPYLRISAPTDIGAAAPTIEAHDQTISFFNGAAGVDYTWSVNGETNDGLITYMEDEDRWDFSEGIKSTTSEATTSYTSPLFKSNAADPADSGVVRLGNTDTICWEEATPGADQCLSGFTSAGYISTNSGIITNGSATAGNVLSTGGVRIPSAGNFSFYARSYMNSPADGILTLSNNGSTTGVSLSVATDDMLYVKDSGNSVGGTVKAATFVSDVADPADVGSIRLGDNQTISWENNPAGADVSVYASAGSIKVNGNFTLGECAAEKYIVWPCMGAMISVADAKFKFLNNLGTQGAMLDAATDGNVSLRNLADSAYATLKASTTTVVVGTKGATSVVGGAEQDLTCAGGGSATLVTSGLIPDGALLDGITTRITTALTGSTGYSVGDGSDPDMFGVAATATQDTVTTPASATASWSRLMLAAGEVTITFAGGNCTAGVVRVVAHYTTLGAPTSN